MADEPDYEEEFEDDASPEKAPPQPEAAAAEFEEPPAATAAAPVAAAAPPPAPAPAAAAPPPAAAAMAPAAAARAFAAPAAAPAPSFSPSAAPAGSRIPIARSVSQTNTTGTSRSRGRISRLQPTPAAPSPGSKGSGSLMLPSIGSGSAIASASADALDHSELLASEQLSLAVEAEMQAQEHLRRVRAKVQRELRKASSMSALNTVREKKLEMAKAMRADLDQRVGRDITERLKSDDLIPASEEEVLHLSKLFNKQLEAYHPDARNFFVLFKHIDIDGSRRISYNELHRLIREELKLRKADLPNDRVLALWKVLDENASGFIDAGELGRFMKIGQPIGGLGSRARILREKNAGRKEQLLQSDKRTGKHITRVVQTTNVPAASDEEVLTLATMFNQQLMQLRHRESSANANFFQLFKKVDVDDSGRISFDELRQMVRHELHLNKEAVPREKLLGLWKVLDENESGFICAGEWGRFMNMRGVHVQAQVIPEIVAKERIREKEMARRALKNAEWKAQAANAAQAKAKQLAAEAEALEAALMAAARGGGGGALPPIGGGNGMRRGQSHGALQALKKTLEETGGGRMSSQVVLNRNPIPRADFD